MGIASGELILWVGVPAALFLFASLLFDRIKHSTELNTDVVTDPVGRASPMAVDAVAAAEAVAAEAETNPTSYSSNPVLFPIS